MTKDSSGQHQCKCRTLDTYLPCSCQSKVAKCSAVLLYNTHSDTITHLRFIQKYWCQSIDAAWNSFRSAGKEVKHFFNALQMEKVEHTFGECCRRFNAKL